MVGDCYRVERELSESLTEEGAGRGDYLRWDVGRERRRLDRRHFKVRLYSFLRHPTKPNLISNNVGLWRTDFERVNGFDENYRGWGQEDDDLGRRLKRAGVRMESILGATRAYHLWHARDPTATATWKAGVNIPYYQRAGGLMRCRNGLVKRSVADLSIRVAGRPTQPDRAAAIWLQTGLPPPPGLIHSADPINGTAPEVEMLFLPGEGRFSGRAECQVLVVLDDMHVPNRLLKNAHRIIADRAFRGIPESIQFRLSDFGNGLDSIA